MVGGGASELGLCEWVSTHPSLATRRDNKLSLQECLSVFSQRYVCSLVAPGVPQNVAVFCSSAQREAGERQSLVLSLLQGFLLRLASSLSQHSPSDRHHPPQEVPPPHLSLSPSQTEFSVSLSPPQVHLPWHDEQQSGRGRELPTGAGSQARVT